MKVQLLALCVIFFAGIIIGHIIPRIILSSEVASAQTEDVYWFDLHRKSQIEFLYSGIPGDKENSKLVKAFRVKVGQEGRPTPLPELYGREYWVITHKYPTTDIIETAPYFIELNIPHHEKYPFGPSPYLECGINGQEQCNWEIPGPFGLHGINLDITRLDSTNPGSSGCIRHTDEDITYLYHLLDLSYEIRYYVSDS